MIKIRFSELEKLNVKLPKIEVGRDCSCGHHTSSVDRDYIFNVDGLWVQCICGSTMFVLTEEVVDFGQQDIYNDIIKEARRSYVKI